MSEYQDERQSARVDGRYTPMNKCESCGKPLGAGYYSAANSGETGRGVCLCKKCCTIWDKALVNKPAAPEAPSAEGKR
jgi:hypothetical protein